MYVIVHVHVHIGRVHTDPYTLTHTHTHTGVHPEWTAVGEWEEGPAHGQEQVLWRSLCLSLPIGGGEGEIWSRCIGIVLVYWKDIESTCTTGCVHVSLPPH